MCKSESMIIQSTVLPNSICDKKELFFHTIGEVAFDKECIRMKCGSRLDSFTYMNVFDSSAWNQYTEIKEWVLRIMIEGTGVIKLISQDFDNRVKNGTKQLCCQSFSSDRIVEIEIPFVHSGKKEMVYFEVDAEAELAIWKAQYCLDTNRNYKKNIHMGVIICTYKRNAEVEFNIKQLCESEFFNPKSDLYGKMSIRIVDNASELPKLQQKYCKLYHNPNTGGSGGFTRGIIETRKEEKEYGITHVIFMDDDVKFLMESFYRLYALLCCMSEKYSKEAIAGRMFRMDKQWIQYTAAEIWNAGQIRHIGWNADMTKKEQLYSLNENTGAEYGGWWFACFPMDFVRENIPLPFFLHCDDVEYGLRHGGTPIIMNGIQVWHETYEYRQSPVIAYYDTRNTLIVNALYGLLPEKEVVIEEWKRKISRSHVEKDYLSEYMIILGMWDFCKGRKWLHRVKSEKKHLQIARKKYLLRLKNFFLWRYTYIVCKIRIKNKGKCERNIRNEI